MKKTYVSPLMTEVNIEAAQMLAASLKMGSDDQTVDTSAEGQQLGGAVAANGVICGSNPQINLSRDF